MMRIDEINDNGRLWHVQRGGAGPKAANHAAFLQGPPLSTARFLQPGYSRAYRKCAIAFIGLPYLPSAPVPSAWWSTPANDDIVISVVNVWPHRHTICHGTLWPEAREEISKGGRFTARGIRAAHAAQPKVGHALHSIRHRPKDQHTACLACLEGREVRRSERGQGSDSSHHGFRSQTT